MKEWLLYTFESKIYVTHLMELLAALAGSIYIYLSKDKKNDHRIFVRFLWSVLLIDIVGGYAGLAYFDNYEHFQFLKGTPFVRNNWYFNIAEVYFISFYSFFLLRKMSSAPFRKILKRTIILYIIFAIINMYLADDFFGNDVVINYIVGAFLILSTVFLYFFDMMMSDEVLSFYKKLTFYIAVGISISFLVRVPISIYNEFITVENVEFNNVFFTVIRYSNVFMYTMFALGFYMNYKYQQNRSNLMLQNT